MNDIAWALVHIMDGIKRHELQEITGLAESDCERLWDATQQAREVLEKYTDQTGEILQAIDDPDEPEEDNLIFMSEAMDILNISRPYLYELIDAGDLSLVYLGTHSRLRLSEVKALRDSRNAERQKVINDLSSINTLSDSEKKNEV